MTLRVNAYRRGLHERRRPETPQERAPKGPFVALGSVLSLTTSAWSLSISGAVRLLFAGRVLGPSDWGTWSLVMLIVGYGLLADLGAVAAMSREIPAARMDGPQSVSRVATAALLIKAVSLAVMGVLFAVVAARASVAGFNLAAAFGILVVSAADQFLVTLALGREAHQAVVARNWVLAVSGLVLPVLGSYIFGLTGFLFGYLVAQCLAILPVMGSGRVIDGAHRLQIEMRRLFGVGLPLMVLGLLGATVVNVDQWVILAWLDRSALGLYAIALSAGALVCVIPAAMASVTLPHLVRGSEAGETAGNARITQRAMRSVSGGVTVAVVAGLWLIEPIVTRLLPRYVAAVGPARVYLVAAFFLATNQGVGGSMLAARRHGVNIPLTLGVALVNFAVDYLLVYRLNMGLLGVAVGSLVTYVVYAFVHSVVLHRTLEYAGRVSLRSLLVAFAPGLVLPFHLLPTGGAYSLMVRVAASVLALGVAVAFLTEALVRPLPEQGRQ